MPARRHSAPLFTHAQHRTGTSQQTILDEVNRLLERAVRDDDPLTYHRQSRHYWYAKGYNPVAVTATLVGAILAMCPVLLGGRVFGMAGAAQ
jgi:hypothetical protein